MMKFLKSKIRKIKNKFKRKKKKSEKNVPMSSSIVIVDQNQPKKETSVLDVNLLDDNATTSDKKKVRQYTKSLITALTICACSWITISYVLAFVALIRYGNTDVLSTLSEKVCEVILGAVSAYCLKAFFETFVQKGMELIDGRVNHNIINKKEDDNNENYTETFTDTDDNDMAMG